MAIPAWTKEERAHLQALQGKLDHVRDVVGGVVKRYHTGALLHGEGGTGKSYTVMEELRRLKANCVCHNSRMTARGLVDHLQRCPDDIHLIEDAETLMEDKKSFGVLRSALWSQSRKKPAEREITWSAFRMPIRFVFTGGIIIISNVNLAEEVPEVRALKTRINVLGLDIDNQQIRALMKKICEAGEKVGEDYMTPDECWEVSTFIIDKLELLHRNLDLRLLRNGFRDYLQYKKGDSKTHWQVLLEGRMAERVVYQGRAKTKDDEHRTALEIHRMLIPAGEKYKLFHGRTGLSEKAYYRALNRKK
jgi:hypothetical protein